MFVYQYKFREDELKKHPTLSKEWQGWGVRFGLGEAMQWCQNQLYGRPWRILQLERLGDGPNLSVVCQYTSEPPLPQARVMIGD